MFFAFNLRYEFKMKSVGLFGGLNAALLSLHLKNSKVGLVFQEVLLSKVLTQLIK